MDEKTKAQCGLIPDSEESEEFGGTGTFSNGEPIPYEPEGYTSGETQQGFTDQCQSGALTIDDGCSSADTPYDDGPGSLYTNPEADPYKRLDESACPDDPAYPNDC
ncbi:hypothetical protein [Saccharopolyspora tripterygii]